MPKAKPVVSISEMIDTDIEDGTLAAEHDALPTPDSNQENAPTRKRGGRGKATTKRFTKPRVTRHSGDSLKVTKAPPKAKAGRSRAPLKEKTNLKDVEETEEVEEFEASVNEDTAMDELVAPKPPAKRKASDKKAGRPAKKPALSQTHEKKKDGEFEYTPTTARQTKAVNKKSGQQAQNSGLSEDQAVTEPGRTIPETQVPKENEAPEDNDDDENEDALPQSVFRKTNTVHNTGRQRQMIVPAGRAGSTSDAERSSNDPGTRRRLGEMTRKFENLDMKYRNLREVGIKEAEARLSEYKTQSQAKAKAADDLIASLKKEVAAQKALAQDSRSLQKEIATRDADLTKTQALANQLSTSLSEAQNENKAIQAKLANSRNASAAVESLNARTPGSAVRGKTSANRTLMVGSAEVAQAAQVAQLKEDLYSDLTGLLLRGVERADDADVYDCLQTGSNGTLHFKLAVARDTDGGYENTEFQYTPRLDANRDRDLIASMPEYLTDEITFSRTNAAMFYGRVVDCLTKKRKPVDE